MSFKSRKHTAAPSPDEQLTARIERWKQETAREGYYAKVPAEVLERQACDAGNPLAQRVYAYLCRMSWALYSQVAICGLYDLTPLAQADIAKALNVTRGAVSKIIAEKVRRGYLRIDENGHIHVLRVPAKEAATVQAWDEVAAFEAFKEVNRKWAAEYSVLQAEHAALAVRMRKHRAAWLTHKRTAKTSSSVSLVPAPISNDDESISDISHSQRIPAQNVNVTGSQVFPLRHPVTETEPSNEHAAAARAGAYLALPATAAEPQETPMPAVDPGPPAPVVLSPAGAAEVAAVFAFDVDWGTRMLRACRETMGDVTPAEVIALTKRKYDQLRRGIQGGRYENVAGLLLSAVPRMAEALAVVRTAAAVDRARADKAAEEALEEWEDERARLMYEADNEGLPEAQRKNARETLRQMDEFGPPK